MPAMTLQDRASRLQPTAEPFFSFCTNAGWALRAALWTRQSS
ncbi:unnamed protein product [Spirodela intermedia]|uniref:Uncharacterized protein n=2 Tax=Spirodela intermedia TaxID=51605 RepID=A0A7I8JHJ4_SPIIN|nr:unnamed protein product [Spirodela intermedia]CAA6669604.1 unnamed protein product [Spirodela intermedia]CAA7406569.1 unnamed protein product [Spirodela intermedia]